MDQEQIEQQNRKKRAQKLKQNSQYFYIRVMGIDYIKPKQKAQLSNTNPKALVYDILFEMSDKSSRTKIKTDSKYNIPAETMANLKKESHLFCYEAEEMLNVSFSAYMDWDVKGKKKKLLEEGYARFTITPFVVFPYTRHKVKVNLYKIDEDRRISKTQIATLRIQISYLLKFEADLQIYPFEGDFDLSTPALGQTRLGCRFTINNQTLRTIIEEEGGIHPKWHEFATVQNFSTKKPMGQETFQLVEQNLLKFKLKSVGHTLKVQVINYPFLDKDAQLVGSADIRISSQDFLRFPNQPITEFRRDSFSNSTYFIKLTRKQPTTKKEIEVGTLTIGKRFIFNVNRIQEMLGEDDDKFE